MSDELRETEGVEEAAEREPLKLDSDQIQKILPHRYPFAMVDRIDDCEPGKWAKGRKCISVNEMQFMGHFPELHVMPGVLILEALAQVGAIAVLLEPGNEGKVAFFGGVKKCRFKQKVVPGDVLELECELIERRGPLGVGKAKATVDGKVACTAELTFALE
jgi:3-hydroxyacyl-[acyl-carrier-protein] dehydratase